MQKSGKRLTVSGMVFFISGIILFLWFFLPLLVTRNPNIGALTGIGISVLLIVYGIWQKPIHRLVSMLWKTTGGRILEILLLVICAAILSLAAATSVAMISGASKTAEPGSTVIVLGARVYENRVSTAMAGRLNAAIQYLKENPDSVCIVSGGQGKNEPVTEASMMYQYLENHGIPKERIYLEDRSTDTDENLRFSKEIIEKNGLNPVVGLATDGYHEYRALKYAQKHELTAGAIPATTAWWLFPTSVIREMYGILEQWFLKR